MFNVFVKLKAEIEADVNTRNEQLKIAQTPRILRLEATGDESFAVTLSGNGIGNRAVTFRQIGETIVIRDRGGNVLIEAGLTLNDDGNCKLKVGESERESWQIRRTALEDLFFGLA